MDHQDPTVLPGPSSPPHGIIKDIFKTFLQSPKIMAHAPGPMEKDVPSICEEVKQGNTVRYVFITWLHTLNLYIKCIKWH